MEAWSPKIVAFLCTWCSYAGADLAGTGRNQYPPNIRVIRIPCSGRINPLYIIKALLEGADGVMVSGCHPGDCHYLVGNYYARRRFVVLKKLLTTAGIEADRVHFTWVSASEGARFADVVKEVTEKVTAMGPSTIVGAKHNQDSSGNNCPQNDSAAVILSDSEESYSFEEQQSELIPLCKKLLEGGTVSIIIGFQEGGEMGLSVPYFLNSPAEADKLVWNNRCVPNLSGYLCEVHSSPGEMSGKTAIIAKPCDARAVICLTKENQLKRDDVHIIGLTCDGMVDENGTALPACMNCKVRIPPVYDTLVSDGKQRDGSGTQGDGSPVLSAPQDCISAICQNNTEEPSPCVPEPPLCFERFASEMEKCILCFSCRQSCYGCYCKTCFVERGEPDWQTASPDIGTKMLYHLGRATHLSGRCVECGACENACASGVDIRYLIREVTNFIEETYDYQAGMDLATEPAMLSYKTDDPEIGFLGFENPNDNGCTGGDAGV